VVAGGFTALLSLFNIGGRFVWASMSDKLGRKLTYTLFFVLGAILYASIPSSAGAGSKLLFVGACCMIVSMYGGGFATVPAYLADMFGTQFVGAIHGRLLTAWATAGILGPVVVNYMREYQLGLGLPREQVYNQTMYILVGMLVIGFICQPAGAPGRRQALHDRRRTRRREEAPGAREGLGGRSGQRLGPRRRGEPAGGGAGLGGRGHSAGLGRLQDAGERGEVLQLIRQPIP
jgi:MFS family permease